MALHVVGMCFTLAVGWLLLLMKMTMMMAASTSTLPTLDPQPHTNTSIPATNTLISSLLPINDSMDVDSMAPPSDALPGTGAKQTQVFTTAFPTPTILASSGISNSPSSSTHFSLNPSSHNPLSNLLSRPSLGASSPLLNLTSSKHYKSLLAPAASSQAPSVGGSSNPSQCKGAGPKHTEQLANFNDALSHMTDVMENQNLIFQVPVPALTHTWVFQVIQDDASGYFSMEEKGKIIHYIINNPSAATYEALNDELHQSWLHTVVDG